MSQLALFGGIKTRIKPFTTSACIGDEEKRRVQEVLKSGNLSGFIARSGDCFFGGPQVRDFEDLVRNYFGMKHAIAVNSATAGLHVALAACGTGPGDEVIVPPYTMSASATSILMQNAIPKFVDIDEETFCIDPSKIENAITSKTKAIIVVHLFGYPANIKDILSIAKKHNLFVIEDSAQSPGALYDNQYVGTFGDIGVFSLNQHKTITCGEGGFAVTNNDNLALKMQLIRNHGESYCDEMGVNDIGIVGFNYRMTELEAAVAVGQFKRLDFFNDYRIQLAEYLTKELSSFSGLKLPKNDSQKKHVYFVYPIKFDKKVFGVERDLFVSALNAEGIPFGAGYIKPIYLSATYQNRKAYSKGCPFVCQFSKNASFDSYFDENCVPSDYKKGICPVTEKMYEQELMVSGVCRYPHTTKDIDDVVEAFQKIITNINELTKNG